MMQDQSKATANEQHTPTETHEATSKDKVKVESIKELSKGTRNLSHLSNLKRCMEIAKYRTTGNATLRGMWSLNAYRPCTIPFVTAMTMPKSAAQNGVSKNQLLPLAAMRLKD
jgi:hypothetical protein